MTAPSLLDELEGVVRLAETATPGEWSHQESTSDTCGFEVVQKCLNGDVVAGEYGIHEYDDARLIAAAVNFLRAHHAELAAMAKRLEAAERDAARWRHARKLLTVDDIEGAQGSYDSFGRLVSEDECKRADDAIDAAAREGEG